MLWTFRHEKPERPFFSSGHLFVVARVAAAVLRCCEVRRTRRRLYHSKTNNDYDNIGAGNRVRPPWYRRRERQTGSARARIRIVTLSVQQRTAARQNQKKHLAVVKVVDHLPPRLARRRRPYILATARQPGKRPGGRLYGGMKMRVIGDAAPTDANLEEGENLHELSSDIISLMGYKDAHAVLGLRSGAHHDDGAIREAYEANKRTIEQSIQKIDVSISSANVGQMNYLQLKLQALDQALSELSSNNGQLAGRVPEQTRTKLPSSHQRFVSNMEDDDDLDTIDIYFHANRNKTAPHRAKSPSDLSSISGSTIFSFVSEGVRQIKDDISESGLSDLLGPLPEEVPEEKHNAAPSTKPHYERPPLGKREPKQRKVKSQVSPTSVVFHQNIHRSLEYDNSTTSPGNQTVGRGKVMERIMRDSRRARATGEDSDRANIEAARHGIIMAISEEDSECIALDSDFITRRPCTSSKAAGHVEARRVSRHPKTDEDSERFFNG